MTVEGKVFLDSNVLIYGEDSTIPAKRDRARGLTLDLMRSKRGVISAQVLGEFFVTVTRTIRNPLTDAQAVLCIRDFSNLLVAPLDLGTVQLALGFKASHQVSYWDALILASALEAGCSVVYSEDLTHDQDYGGGRVVNPFVQA